MEFQNRTAEDRLGLIAGRRCWETIAQQSEMCHFCGARDAIASGRATSAEVPLPDGQWLLVQWNPLTRAGETSTTEVVESITDITDMKNREAQLEDAVARLNRAADEDSLTGLLNRRGVMKDVLRLAGVAARQEQAALAVVLLDIDHFKRVNDRYGHEAGDDVLSSVAEAMRQELRENIDVYGRWGGEEFIVVAPVTVPEGSAAVAERVRRAIAAVTKERCGIDVSASAGVAEWSPTSNRTDALVDQFAASLRLADTRLYAAKSLGRDAVVAA